MLRKWFEPFPIDGTENNSNLSSKQSRAYGVHFPSYTDFVYNLI